MYPVSLRFDPCFPKVDNDDSHCVRQLRIVWQSSGSDDAAVHTLYNLSKDTFAKAVAELIRLKKESGMTYDGQLDVHPILAKQGIDGAFGKGLVALIKSIAGKDNLVNIAFLILAPGGRAFRAPGPWRFGALDVTNGQIAPRSILNTKFQKQEIVGFDGSARSISKDTILQLMPPPTLTPSTSPLYLLGIQQAGTEMVFHEQDSIAGQSPADFEKSYEFLLATSNPYLTSIMSNACADCHVGSQEANAIDWVRPDLKTKLATNRFQPEIAPLDSFGNPVTNFVNGNFHNFGYWEHYVFLGYQP